MLVLVLKGMSLHQEPLALFVRCCIINSFTPAEINAYLKTVFFSPSLMSVFRCTPNPHPVDTGWSLTHSFRFSLSFSSTDVSMTKSFLA